MRIFVAGATGAIGRPLISALVAAGHDAIGMTTSEDGLRTLRDKGADGVVVNALDSSGIKSAIEKVRPDAVIEELTSLPRKYTPEEMRAAAPRDHKLRLEGGRNVQDAAQGAGARRYIVQSTGFFYAPGPGLAAETDPLAMNASPAIAGSVRTYMQIEERVLGAPGLEGIALRYGFFYGPGTYHDLASGSVTEQVRKREYPVIGSGQGVYAFVHVEDAAAATVAALEGDPGVYNIVDDDPSELEVWLPAFASAIGAPEPPRISEEDALKTAGPDSVYYATQLRGASNLKAKRQLGFAPRRLEWLAKRSATA
ncbi:MAG TPA: NAD(P)-dependent oxidoreductase [Bryobacteraceae bacterium]|jgi:nucleoside-diphosphate-sugar epimerase|nr:NAD(P)-dependent oxidoreductase [Bryobacteraceae bacterium]